MIPSTERTGLAQMAAAMTLSGTLGVFVLESGQSAWNVVFFRCVFGALSLFLYCWARGLLKPGLFTPKTLALALAAGAALVLNWVLLFSAYRLASISLATAVYNVQPFFLIGLGVLFLGERPSRGKVAWSLVAFAGLLLVLRLGSPGAAGGGAYLSGLMLGLGAAALYAVTAIIVKRLKGIAPQVLALVQVTLGAVMLLPMADFNALPAQPAQWGCLVALGAWLWRGIPAIIRWTYDSFAMARSTPPMSVAPLDPNRSQKKRACTCWPGWETTFRSPPSESPWTQPTFSSTTLRCRRW